MVQPKAIIIEEEEKDDAVNDDITNKHNELVQSATIRIKF
jgi:hypothetical protein